MLHSAGTNHLEFCNCVQELGYQVVDVLAQCTQVTAALCECIMQ